jgi:hypothetical protein
MLDSLPPSPGGGLKRNLNLNTLEMQGNDNATVTDVSGQSMRLQLTPEGWKILMGAKTGADAQAAEFAMIMLEGLAMMADLMDTLASEVNSGQITSLDQLEKAMEAGAGSMGF